MIKKNLWSLSVIMLFLCLSSCSTTKITDSWQDKNYSGGPFKNILVISQFLDEEVCRMSELEQVRDLKRRGVSAKAAYSILSAGGRSSVDAIDDAIAQYSFDAVLISKVGNRMEESGVNTNSACANRWDSDYRQNQRYALSPCRISTGMQTTSIYILETKLYSTKERIPVIALSSKTTDIRPAYELIKDFGKVVISRLDNAGLLAKNKPGK